MEPETPEPKTPSGGDPATFPYRTLYHDNQMEIWRHCGCWASFILFEGTMAIAMDQCHIVHDILEDTSTWTDAIRYAFQLLQETEQVALPPETAWQNVSRHRCDFCGKRRLCASWTMNINDTKPMHVCRPCDDPNWREK